MSIQNDNYEEFFLMYADNELSEAERMEVEAFVMNNPHLAEEFEMMQLAVYVPDETVSLTDKSFLLRSANESGVNIKNYEENFVLFHDGELDSQQERAVTDFLTKNPELQSQSDLLKIARMSPDDRIKFPDKKLLYKNEAPGRVIRLFLYRSVAAALIAGFGLWMGFQYFNNVKEQQMVAGLSGSTEKTEPKISEKNGTSTENQPPEEQLSQQMQVADAGTATQKEDLIPQVGEKRQDIKRNDVHLVAAITKSHIETDRPELEKEIIQSSGEIEVIESQAIALHNSKAEIAPQTVYAPQADIDLTDYSTKNNQFASSASLREEPGNDDYIFFNVPAEEFNKTKVAGFLKKVKRIVERNDPIKRLLAGDENVNGK